MKIEIKNRFSGEVIFSHESEENSINITLLKAIESGADLSVADLRGANLSGANLRGASSYYSFFAFGTSGRIVHCVKWDECWMIQAGCFWGTLSELEAKVLKAHGKEGGKVYLANIDLLKKI